jgi:alpha-galactosidase
VPGLSLESPFYSFFLRLPEGRWDLIAGDAARIEQARLGALIGSKAGDLHWDGRMEGAEVEHHGFERGIHGPVHSARLRIPADGLTFRVEFAACLERPLFLLRVGLTNAEAETITLDAIDMLHLGPAGPGDVRSRQRDRGLHTTGTVRLHADPGDLAFFTNGFQSWSYAGTLGPDDPMPRTRLGPILWPENPDTPVTRRRGEFVAHMFGVLVDRTHRSGLLAGFLSQRQTFGTLRARLTHYAPSLRLWAHGDQVEVRAGHTLQTDWACLQPVAVDSADPLGPYLDAVAVENGVHAAGPAPVGWCSWYKYMKAVSQREVEANLSWAADQRKMIPLRVFQLDDGYQAPDAELLETNERFPDGLGVLANRISSQGFLPGLWLAPFITAPGSALARRHPSWILRGRRGVPANAGSTWSLLSRGLDVTHPEVEAWARRLVRTAAHECGFRYLKLDFLYAGVLEARRHDPTRTRAQALGAMLRAIRQEVGPEVTLLGCGCPIGSGLGVFDAMRIGTDVAPAWHPTYFGTQCLIRSEPTFPAVRNVLRNILARMPLHRRWWVNDPDCLLVRQADTRLTPDEVQTLATVLALSGGSMIVSDDLPALAEERVEWLARLLPPLQGRARVLDALDTDRPAEISLEQQGAAGRWWLCAVLNWDEAPRAMTIDLRRFGLPEAATYLWANPWQQQAGASTSSTLHLGPIPGHGIALMAVRPGSEEPSWLGDTLHVSQGCAVHEWECDDNRLRAVLGMGRPRCGRAWIWLPAEPLAAELDGRPLLWHRIGEGIYAFDLQMDDPSSLTIRW